MPHLYHEPPAGSVAVHEIYIPPLLWPSGKRSIFNSSSNKAMEKYARPVAGRLLYVLAVAAFFLTFFNLRCGTARMAKISGVNMAVGGKVNMMPDLEQWMDDETRQDSVSATDFQRNFFGKKSAINVPVNYWALAALALVILAFMASLLHTIKGYWVQMGLAGAAILSLLGMIFTRHLYALKIMNLDLPAFKRESNLFNQQVILTLGLSWALWLTVIALVLALFIAMATQRRLKIELENEAALEHFNPGEEAAGEYPPG